MIILLEVKAMHLHRLHHLMMLAQTIEAGESRVHVAAVNALAMRLYKVVCINVSSTSSITFFPHPL